MKTVKRDYYCTTCHLPYEDEKRQSGDITVCPRCGGELKITFLQSDFFENAILIFGAITVGGGIIMGILMWGK